MENISFSDDFIYETKTYMRFESMDRKRDGCKWDMKARQRLAKRKPLYSFVLEKSLLSPPPALNEGQFQVLRDPKNWDAIDQILWDYMNKYLLKN